MGKKSIKKKRAAQEQVGGKSDVQATKNTKARKAGKPCSARAKAAWRWKPTTARSPWGRSRRDNPNRNRYRDRDRRRYRQGVRLPCRIRIRYRSR